VGVLKAQIRAFFWWWFQISFFLFAVGYVFFEYSPSDEKSCDILDLLSFGPNTLMKNYRPPDRRNQLGKNWEDC
jgi:hypothetical protein